ncbi:hypothetical protein ACWERI_38635 [Streptomyces collinus]
MGGDSPYWTDYGYDSIGNRTSEVRHGLNGKATSTRTYAYGKGSGPGGKDSGPHTVSSITQKTEATGTTPEVTSQDSHQDDASGNTTKRILDGDTQSLGWDTQGEQTMVTNADNSLTSWASWSGRSAGGSSRPSGSRPGTGGSTATTRSCRTGHAL